MADAENASWASNQQQEAGEVDMGGHGLEAATPTKSRRGRYAVIRPGSSKKKKKRVIMDVDWTQLDSVRKAAAPPAPVTPQTSTASAHQQQQLVITVSDTEAVTKKEKQRQQLARCLAKQQELRLELRRLIEVATGPIRTHAQVVLEHLTLSSKSTRHHDRSKSFILVSGQVHVPSDVHGVFAPRNSPPRRTDAPPGGAGGKLTAPTNKNNNAMKTPQARHRPNKSIVLFPSGASLQQLLKPDSKIDDRATQPTPARARWQKAVKTISGLRHIIQPEGDGDECGDAKSGEERQDRYGCGGDDAPTPKKTLATPTRASLAANNAAAASAGTPPRTRQREAEFDSVIKHVFFFQYEQPHEQKTQPSSPTELPRGLSTTAFPPPTPHEEESLANLWLFALLPGPLMQRVSHVHVERLSGTLPPPPPYTPGSSSSSKSRAPPALPYQTRPSFLDFVLTDIEGNRLFACSVHYYELRPSHSGGLLYAARSFVVLSHYPFHTAFRGLLGEMHRLQTTGNLPVEKAREWLELVTQELVLPVPGGLPVRFPFGSKWFECALPSGAEFPLLDLDVYDTLFRRLSVDNIMTVFVAMLTEQRVLFHSNNHARLCPIAECFHALLFPFRWYHVFIPVLPSALIDLTDAPVPYVIGVHSSSAARLSQGTVESVFVVDIDNNTVRRPSSQQPYAPTRLPPAQEYDLRHALRTILEDHNRKKTLPAAHWQFEIRHVFFNVFASLLRHYRKHMFFLGAQQSYPIFNAETFLHDLETRGNADAREFLSYFLSSQLFAWFLENSDHTSCFHDAISNDTSFNKTPLVKRPFTETANKTREPFVIQRVQHDAKAATPPPPPYSPTSKGGKDDIVVVTSTDSAHKSVVHLKRDAVPVWALAARLPAATRPKPRDFMRAYYAQVAAIDGALPSPVASTTATATLARDDSFHSSDSDDGTPAASSQLRRLSSGANILPLAASRNESDEVAGLQELLAKVFLGERIAQAEKVRALEQLDQAHVRQRLVRVLSQQNQFQGKVRLTKWSFAVVREFVERLLTLSHRTGDYATAKLVFAIGAAFYVEDDGMETNQRDFTVSRQTFLETFIAEHAISRSPELWETFYQEDVIGAVRACTGSSEAQQREVVVQSVSSLINTMLTYGVEKRLVIRLVNRVASEHSLTASDKELLEVLTINLSMALSMHNESLAATGSSSTLSSSSSKVR